MMHGPLFVLTLLAALGCALVGGVLFAFSSFLMRALARLPASQGIAAMQAVNAQAPTPAFMAALFGTAALCTAVAVGALLSWHEPYAPHLLTGALLYLVGAIALTVTFHVPRNDALARVHPDAPDAPEAAAHWHRYARTWTTGNHVRTAAALAAATVLTLALTAR